MEKEKMILYKNLVYKEIFKIVRKYKKLTQKEAANILGVSEITVRRYELGISKITRNILWSFIGILKIEGTELINIILGSSIYEEFKIEGVEDPKLISYLIKSTLKEIYSAQLDFAPEEMTDFKEALHVIDYVIQESKSKRGKNTLEVSKNGLRSSLFFYITQIFKLKNIKEKETVIEKYTDEILELVMFSIREKVSKYDLTLDNNSKTQFKIDDLITDEIIEDIKGKVGFYGEQLEKSLTKLEEKIWERYKELHIDDKD